MTQHLGQRHHAGVLRQALRQRTSLKIAASVIIFIFLIPYTACAVQRTVPPVRHGL
ncbi:MAG: hypothetical protein ACLR0P_02250 [Oscillospiraceae bacterium]